MSGGQGAQRPQARRDQDMSGGQGAQRPQARRDQDMSGGQGAQRRRLVRIGLGLALVAGLWGGSGVVIRTLAERALSDPVAGTTAVTVTDNTFGPGAIRVPTGSTVTWTWAGSQHHDVTVLGGPASPRQAEGTWAHTFDEPGEHRYVCSLHAGMVGLVEVG